VARPIESGEAQSAPISRSPAERVVPVCVVRHCLTARVHVAPEKHPPKRSLDGAPSG
jgi:hypothetical protein